MAATASVPMSAGYYLHWGVIQISLTNFLIIVGMVVLFVAALLLPFPGGHDDGQANLRRTEHDDDHD